MARKTIKINGVDCTALFAPYGYTVSYKKIFGNNGGVMLDGSTVEDVLAIKAVITFPCLPWTESNFNTLLSSIYGSAYASIYYFDPRTNAYRTIDCIYSEISGTHRITNINGQEIWTSGALEFTER